MENLQSKDINQKEDKNETISELAHRHLKNESHTTTDEELENARVVLSQNTNTAEESLFEIDNNTVISPLAAENEDNITNNEKVKDEDKSLPNPYDILGA